MKIKVHVLDKEAGSVVVSTAPDDFSGDMDTLPKYAFQPQAMREADPVKFLKKIMAYAEANEQASASMPVVALEPFEGLVGEEMSFTSEELRVALHEPDYLPTLDAKEAVQTQHDSYPIADKTLVERILAKQFKNVIVEPVIRASDKNIIGVETKEIGGGVLGTGSEAYKSVAKVHDMATRLGVPHMGYFYPGGQQGAEGTSFAQYLEGLGLSVIVFPASHPSYAYTPIDAAMTETRRVATIKAEAQRRIEERHPQWEQSNLLRRQLQLEKQTPRTPPIEQALEEINAVWDWIRSIRDKADLAERSNTLPEDVKW